MPASSVSRPCRMIPMAFALLLAAARADDYSAWPQAKSVYLNTTPDGANITSTVRDFPVLVRLTAADFAFAQAKGKGQDIRFATKGGAHLRYQIDRWDSAKGIAEIWVKVDSIKGNANDSLVMRWGNAAAADSSDGGAVFSGANGYLGVWHLGGTGTAARKNAVAGAFDATTNDFDGDEGTAGAVGAADSLDGNATGGDNMQLGDGYDDFSAGFTFSIWCKPTAASNNSRLLDMGNGPGLDALVLARDGTSDGLILENYANTTKGTSVKAADCLAKGQWQHIAVTVKAGVASIYRNGALAGTGNLGNSITVVRRAFIYLGRNDWSFGSYFQGGLDEAVIAKAARSADWLKLSYANQVPGAAQRLVSFAKPPAQCQASFSVPADTLLGEGTSLALTGGGACATRYSWSAVSGLAPRILDPEDKTLQLFLPRIARDTSFTLRFTAVYADSEHSQDVTIRIQADIPDPVFSLPDTMEWNGKDSLWIKPVISNLAAVLASRHPEMRWAWAMEAGGAEAADTVWREGTLGMTAPAEDGMFTVRLCLDNGGPAACDESVIRVRAPARISARTPGLRLGGSRGYDAAGRMRPRTRAIPVTYYFELPAQAAPKLR